LAVLERVPREHGRQRDDDHVVSEHHPGQEGAEHEEGRAAVWTTNCVSTSAVSSSASVSPATIAVQTAAERLPRRRQIHTTPSGEQHGRVELRRDRGSERRRRQHDRERLER